MKGLPVDILRPADGYDCSNGGISSTVTRAVLCGGGLPDLFESDDRMPALVVRRRTVGGRTYLHAVPADADEERIWYMFGGNFAHSCDSRFSDVCPYPIPIHDRRERAAEAVQ